VNHTASDFKQRKTALLSRCAAAQSLSNAAQIHQHLKWLSDLCDDTLKSLWQQAGIPPDFSLLAVGGYGRQALFPYSDVDVLVLLRAGLGLPEGSFGRRGMRGSRMSISRCLARSMH